MERDHHSAGWLASLQRLAETLLSIIRNRIDLLAVEVQEEKQRVISALICVAVAIFFSFTSVVVITITVVFLVPENVRSFVLIGFSALYVLVALFAALSVRKKVRGRTPFADSVAELKKDIAAIRSRS